MFRGVNVNSRGARDQTGWKVGSEEERWLFCRVQGRVLDWNGQDPSLCLRLTGSILPPLVRPATSLLPLV